MRHAAASDYGAAFALDIEKNMTTLTRRGFALSNKHVSKDLYSWSDSRARPLDFKGFQVGVVFGFFFPLLSIVCLFL